MMPRLPLRKASAIAMGMPASASTTLARISWVRADCSCSLATAAARRISAFACATCLSASACSAWSRAPILSATSTSGTSFDRISKEVPESTPFSKTRREMESGFSRTSLYELAEPTEVTMPSPTRAMTVSSVAPPTKRSRLVRTVTRARTLTAIPSLATAVILLTPVFGLGHSITLGLIEVRTASRTVLPVSLVAKSMAQARENGSSIPALSAATRARTTLVTSPPARK